MLVLSVKVGSRVYIGDYEVLVIETKRGAVRLGITAPREVPIDREEVRVQREEQRAKAKT